jgi:hypothetical protein
MVRYLKLPNDRVVQEEDLRKKERKKENLFIGEKQKDM